MIIYEGKHLKLVRTPGLRFGIGYLPHYKSNNEIRPAKARQLIVWCGPYFATWSLPAPRNYRPIALDNPGRVNRLLEARRDLTAEIEQAREIAWRREHDGRITGQRGPAYPGD